MAANRGQIRTVYRCASDSKPDASGGPVKFAYDGTVEGDEIRMTSTFDVPPPGFESAEQKFTAVRAR